MSNIKRPTSPHLQIYKWGGHMALSILHRATGVALGAGMLLLSWGLISLAYSQPAFEQFKICMSSGFGKAVMLAFTFALMLHMCNGIRHLFWDMGKGFDLDATKRSNVYVLLGSIILTLLAWLIGYGII